MKTILRWRGCENTGMNMTRRFTWLIQLTLLTLFAWVIAGIITTVAGYYLYSVPVPRDNIALQNNPGKEKKLSREDYNVIVERDLLKVSKSGPASGQEGLDKDAVRPIAELGLILKGTIAGPKEIARAIIESKNEQKIYKIDDEIMGATLIAIFRNKVIMNVGGQEQMLIMEESSSGDKGGGPSPISPARFSRSRGPSGASSGMTNVMKNLDQYIGKARVVPYFKGGEPYGFRVSNLGSDAMVYDLGVRAGDIIRSVNGTPIRTPEDAFKAYQQFQNESSVQIELERNGQASTVTVPLKK